MGRGFTADSDVLGALGAMAYPMLNKGEITCTYEDCDSEAK